VPIGPGDAYRRQVSVTAAPPLARGLFFGTAAIWVVLEARQGANHRADAVTADQGSRPVLRVANIIGVVSALVAARSVPSAAIQPRALAAWIGLAVFWCGVGLRLWCFRTLGHYFTFTVQTSGDQPVITAGPYRVIRHPSYAGVVLVAIGIGLFIGNWLSLACLTTAVFVGVVYRIRVEERALLRDLGDGYRDYAATHRRLVPFIW
jgi:protein-S-isoprenylcysteine O-methyltransferase Ste14